MLHCEAMACLGMGVRVGSSGGSASACVHMCEGCVQIAPLVTLRILSSSCTR